jgi:hypothetical protein
MPKYLIAFTLLVSVLVTACTDGDARLSPIEPSITTASNVGLRPSIGLASSVLSSQRAHDPRCPEVPPFFVPFSLTVGAGSDADVALDAVRLRFADVVTVAPQVTLPQPSLSTQFGSTVVSARSSRTFPFLFRFGCGTGRTGTLIIIVDARVRGQITSTELRAQIVDSR